jgi:hypothetical protein
VSDHDEDAHERRGCPCYRRDQNGECIDCDEPEDGHTPEALLAGVEAFERQLHQRQRKDDEA